MTQFVEMLWEEKTGQVSDFPPNWQKTSLEFLWFTDDGQVQERR